MSLNGASEVEVEKSLWVNDSIALFPTTSSTSSMRTMSHPTLSHCVRNRDYSPCPAYNTELWRSDNFNVDNKPWRHEELFCY